MDGVACTTNVCVQGFCVFTPDNTACDNGLFCDGSETCDEVNDCQARTPVVWSDAVGCTADACDEATDSCAFVPSDVFCDNGTFCDGAETCDPANDCQAGTPVECGDGVGCTIDACNEGTGSCDNTPDNTICADGAFCNGDELCDATNDCQVGTPVECGDGVGCTIDACNEGTDSCDNTPDNSACDNGMSCDGSETCDATSDCQAGTPVVCTGDDCNLGMCDEDNDNCSTTPTNAGGMCGDQMDTACTDPDTCDANGFCQPNNEACAAVTSSALCEFDFSPKGICAIGELAIDNSGAEIMSDSQSTVGCSVDSDCTGIDALASCIDENQFRLQFTLDGRQWPAHKISNTNPGQFFYNAILSRTVAQTCDTLQCSFTGAACTEATVETDWPGTSAGL